MGWHLRYTFYEGALDFNNSLGKEVAAPQQFLTFKQGNSVEALSHTAMQHANINTPQEQGINEILKSTFIDCK